MKLKEEISRLANKDGYIIVRGIVDGEEMGTDDWETTIAVTPEGHWIGDVKQADYLCGKRGIKPELRDANRSICSIGFCEAEQKWYGWSHRVIFGFGVGDVVSEGDCTASSGWTDEYLAEHPEKDLSLPVGFRAKTLDDAKRMAIAFADSVG